MTYCYDPYQLGCHREATGSMLGHTINQEFDFIETVIYLCDSCCWWWCDWDYEAEPRGPLLTGAMEK